MATTGRHWGSSSPGQLYRIGGIVPPSSSSSSRSSNNSQRNNGVTTRSHSSTTAKPAKELSESDIELILAKSVKTNRLDLSYHNLSSVELIHFVNDGIMRHSHQWNLVEVNFASCQISVQGLDLLVPVLCSIRTLEIIILRNNHLNKDCGLTLNRLLLNVGGLKLLDVGGNHLGDVGISGFSSAFNENITNNTDELSLFSLQFLDLSNNGFGDPGVLSLCRGILQFVRRSQGIGRHIALKILKLSGSKMTDKGIQCLAQLINSSKPIVPKNNGAINSFHLEELGLENCSAVSSKGLAMLFGDPKNSSYCPLRKLSLSLNKSLNIDLLKHLSFCIQYGSCRLEVVHLEFSQDRAKECIRQSAKIYGGLISTDEYSLSEAFRELVDTLLNINHTQDVILKRIFLGSLPKSVFEMCVEGMDKGDVNLYNDCIKALEYMNPAADIFQIPYITNISSWVRSKMYSNMLYITTPVSGVSTNQLVSNKLENTSRSRPNSQATISNEFQSQSLQQQFLSEKERINESMYLGRGSSTSMSSTPIRSPTDFHSASLTQSMGTLNLSDLHQTISSRRFSADNSLATAEHARHQFLAPETPSSPLFIPGMDISSAFPQAAEYLKSKIPLHASFDRTSTKQQSLISEKYLSHSNSSIPGLEQKPNFASDKSLDFTILELREQEILKTRKDHADALTALSKEIVKLVEDSPTKVFDQLDKLKSDLAESKKIENEMKKLKESIPKPLLEMDDEEDDMSDEVKQALEALNRKMETGKMESKADHNPETKAKATLLKPNPLISGVLNGEPVLPQKLEEVGNTTLLLQENPDIMRVSSPIQLTLSSTMGPLSPRSRCSSPNSIRIAQAMIHNSVENSITNLHNQSQSRAQSPQRLFSPSRNLMMSPRRHTNAESLLSNHDKAPPPPLSIPPANLPEKKIDQLFDLMSKIFGEVQQIEKKQSEIEDSVNHSIHKFDERIHSLESSTSNIPNKIYIPSKQPNKGQKESDSTKAVNKESVKEVLADRLISSLQANSLLGMIGDMQISKIPIDSASQHEANVTAKHNLESDMFERLIMKQIGHEEPVAHQDSIISPASINDRSAKDDDTDSGSVASLYSLPRFSNYDPNFNNKYDEDKQYFQQLQSNLAYLSNTPASPLASHFGVSSNVYEKGEDEMSQSDVSMLSSTTRSTTPGRFMINRDRPKSRPEEKRLPQLPVATLPLSSSLRKSNDQGKPSPSPSVRSSRSSSDPQDRSQPYLGNKAIASTAVTTTVIKEGGARHNVVSHPKNGYMLPTASAWHKRNTPVSNKRK